MNTFENAPLRRGQWCKSTAQPHFYEHPCGVINNSFKTVVLNEAVVWGSHPDKMCIRDSDKWVRQLLIAHAGDSPKEIAAQLVNEAKGRGHDDDRTVMVMKIEKLE